MIYEILNDIEIFNTSYKIKLKGFFKNSRKNNCIIESHGQIYLLTSFLNCTYDLSIITPKNLIMLIEDAVDCYIVDEEISLDNILNHKGALMSIERGIYINPTEISKFTPCNQEDLIKYIFSINYKK